MMKVVKIFHLVNTLSAGGAELHLLTLCRHLKRHGVELVVAYLKEGRESRPLRADFQIEGIRVVPLVGERVWDGRYLLRAIKLLKHERPHLLHTHLPRADLVGFITSFLFPSIPWVCSVHGIYSSHWSGRWTLPLFHLVWRRANRVIAISEAVKDWLVRDYSVPANRVQVIHYGIEPDRFTTPSQDLRPAWGLDNELIIGTVGRLEAIKGIDLLIQAMPEILRQIPNATLLIAGHDPWGYGQTLRSLVKGLGLDGKVRLVGFQSDICSFFHALDVFVFPSRSEGFGQVVIEAMAAGKPVVASRIAPLTEIVVGGETGFLVPPDDPEPFAKTIVRLLSNPEERRRMGKLGIQRVYENFSAKVMGQKTIELYHCVLATHS